MKRATIKLIAFSKITTSSSLISRNSSNQITTCSSSLISNHSSSNNSNQCTNSPTLKPYSNQGLSYKPYQFQKNPQFQKTPSHTYCTDAQNPSDFPSGQKKNKEKSKIDQLFEAAKSAEEMIEAFKKAETSLDEGDLGSACLKIALELEEEGEDHEKVLSFANRALAVFDSNNDDSSSLLLIAMTLRLLGSINYDLNKITDALGCLNRANEILVRLENEGNYSDNELMPTLHDIQVGLAKIKNAMGRREEGLENLKKALELKELLEGEDSKVVGIGNRELAEQYLSIFNFKEGLVYGLKALEIHLRVLGSNSVKVGRVRWLLALIYMGLEEYEKALEQTELAKIVFKKRGRKTDLVRAEVDIANMHIAMGKSEVAVNTLRDVVESTKRDSGNRVLVLITMGKALVHQEKFTDAKSCLEMASSVLDKKEKFKTLSISHACMETSMLYETMKEFEAALSLLKRALALLEKQPQEQHFKASVSSRIGWLLLLTGKVTECIPYLESAAETLKECLGSNHVLGWYIYYNLGVAYFQLGRPQSAAQMFAVAKDIMDESFGPHDNHYIEACQNLSTAYAAMKSYPLAIEFQQKLVDALEACGRSAEDALKEARQLLEQLKVTARVESSKDYPTKALPLSDSTDATRSLQPPQASNVSAEQSG